MNSRNGCLLGIRRSCCAFMFSVGGHVAAKSGKHPTSDIVLQGWACAQKHL